MRSVLVTGASTGIGRATALRLDSSGWQVFAGVRKKADAESLRAEASPRLAPVTLDVTDPGQIAAVAEWIEGESDGGLDGLVNNAGVAVPGPLETIPLDDLRHQLEVNLVAYVAVTQAMLPQIRRAEGRIVLLASIGGRIAFPFGGPWMSFLDPAKIRAFGVDHAPLDRTIAKIVGELLAHFPEPPEDYRAQRSREIALAEETS